MNAATAPTLTTAPTGEVRKLLSPALGGGGGVGPFGSGKSFVGSASSVASPADGKAPASTGKISRVPSSLAVTGSALRSAGLLVTSPVHVRQGLKG